MASERLKELTMPGAIVVAAGTIAGAVYMRPGDDPQAVTLGEMNRTVGRMDTTLAKLNEKLDPMTSRLERLEYWKEAAAPLIIEHGNAIRALQEGRTP